MKVLKVIYDDDTSFILDIVNNIPYKVCIETFNINDYRQKKKVLPIMVRHGTKNIPLIVFEDENLQEFTAIWSEQNPDWKKEIIKILQK